MAAYGSAWNADMTPTRQARFFLPRKHGTRVCEQASWNNQLLASSCWGSPCIGSRPPSPTPPWVSRRFGGRPGIPQDLPTPGTFGGTRCGIESCGLLGQGLVFQVYSHRFATWAGRYPRFPPLWCTPPGRPSTPTHPRSDPVIRRSEHPSRSPFVITTPVPKPCSIRRINSPSSTSTVVMTPWHRRRATSPNP